MKSKHDESVLSSPSFILLLLWKQVEKYVSFFPFMQLICLFCFVIVPNVLLTSDCVLSCVQSCISMVEPKCY